MATVEHAAGMEGAACGHYRAAAAGFDAYLKRYVLKAKTVEEELDPVREGVSRCGGR